MSRYQHFYSKRSLARTPSAIRALQPLSQIPGMISLSGGFPNDKLFPLTNLSFELKGYKEPISLSQSLLKQSLQYSNSYGIPELIKHWKTILNREHPNHKYVDNNDLSVMVTTGSQNGISNCFDMILNEEDSILLENPTYCGALSALYPLRCNLIGIETDNKGLIPSELLKTLQNWKPDVPKPKALYTVPTGQNPAGSTIPIERRKEIYDIACTYDILILEDDPYWFLHYREEEQPESFFSMDSEFRVIRFDSLSKVISSGLRLGFVSGPKELIEKMQLDQQVASLHTCGISQAIAIELFNKWGEEGFNKHAQEGREFYKEKRDICNKLANKYLSDVATWTIPSAGMFMWFKCKGIKDTKQMIETKARSEKVLLVPGESFIPNGNTSSAVRAAFSTATEEQMEEGFKRLKLVIENYKEN